MMRALVACALLAAAARPALGGDFTALGALSQDEFRSVAKDLGAAFSYKGVAPATALGALGVDAGIEATDTRLGHGSLFERAGAGGHSDLVVAKLHVHKGLPGGIDVGAFVGRVADLDATLLGADLRFALVDDALATPAVALRLSGTKATGLGDLRLATGALDAMVSKRFTAITPYAGAGWVRVQGKARDAPLSDENVNEGRVFGGVNLNLALANLAVEAERMGANTSLSVKLGLRF